VASFADSLFFSDYLKQPRTVLRLRTGKLLEAARLLAVCDRLWCRFAQFNLGAHVLEFAQPSFEFTCHNYQINLVMVRLSLALVSGFGVIGALSGAADDVLPSHFNFDRYSAMADHSPFAVATAVAVPAATPDFAKDLYVANAAHSPECDMVTIASGSDQNFKKYLSTMVPVDGYSIARIEWSEKVGETKVAISKDGKFFILSFNQALLSQAASARRAVADQTLPSVPIIHSLEAGQASRAHSRGVIQRNPRGVAAAARTPNPTPPPTPNLEPLEPPQVFNPQQLQQELEKMQNGQLPP
jgi:hypothetical protein